MPALLFGMTGLGDYEKFYAPCAGRKGRDVTSPIVIFLQRKLLARPWVVVMVISLVMMVMKMIVMMKVVVIVVAAAGVSRDRGPMRWWQWRRSGRR